MPPRYPWVWLFIGENEEDTTLHRLTIIGGHGPYRVGRHPTPSGGLSEKQMDFAVSIGRGMLKRDILGLLPATGHQMPADHLANRRRKNDVTGRFAAGERLALRDSPIWRLAPQH